LPNSNDRQEVIMNRIRLARHVAGVLAGLAGTVLACTSALPAAAAYRMPPPGSQVRPVHPPAHVQSIIVGGMPGWQITLIAAAAAVLAAAAALILDRARTARQHQTAPSA
jgi:ABC-type uncharacterized transport system permease subunit